ncbi:geranylgeranyl transferase type I beta subunit [Ophiocordyceps camponoti-floridani]|uniref:Geranylgeranyl transferase type I beta subunit n=1 Tax=Ophiocordyceps camponoti-floridani TaxID=2030778 RepID=A0A8H4Q388_9HYPO|nr:geranylgeranyl transferase type I beta subunit [Ophiocordyceps camponoti-floridani]
MASPPPSVLDRARHVSYWQRCQRSFLPTDYTSNDSSRLTLAFFIVSALDLLSVPLTAGDRHAVRKWVLSLQHPGGGFCGSATHALDGQRAGLGTANLAATSFALLLLASVAGGGEDAWVEDVDVDALVGHVRRGQTYDGGLAETSRHESHAGYAYCGVAALHMLDRPLSSSGIGGGGKSIESGIGDRSALVDFLAQRQFRYLAREEEACQASDGDNLIEHRLGFEQDCSHVGCNGRWNKKADTCYCWWVAAALDMLDGRDVVNEGPARRYLLDITQHRIGGFAKSAGGPPDLFHSYLGLAALALLGEQGLREMDVALCCSRHMPQRSVVRRQFLGRGDDIILASRTEASTSPTWQRHTQPSDPMASTAPPDKEPKPWTDETKTKFRSKPKSEFLDPCQEAAQRSYKCLYRNGGDKSMCNEYFQAYRDCKEAWTKRWREERGRYW